MAEKKFLPIDAKRSTNTSLLIACTILALTSLRLIHLEADTPTDIGTESMGTYVDEGYKTLDPRNLVLFGSTKWHPDDDFRGYMEPRFRFTGPGQHWSPLTQWTYYLAFRILGPQLSSVRIATIAFFALFLTGYAYSTARHYPPGVFLLGMALLGLQSSLFFYSRIALFVVPVIVCVYWVLFILRRLKTASPYRALGLIFISTIILSFGVKLSAPIYFTPILLGFVWARWIAQERPKSKSAEISLVTASLFFLGLLAFFTRNIWWGRFDPSGVLENTLLNPLLNGAALWVTKSAIRE